MRIAQDETVPAFFLRNGLWARDVETCLEGVRERYTRKCTIVPLDGDAQGGCSYTLVVRRRLDEDDDDEVIQIRMMEHAIPRAVARDVGRWFGELVPRALWFEEVDLLGGSRGRKRRVQVCGMTMVKGAKVSQVLPRRERLEAREVARLKGLVGDLAGFFAVSWRTAAVRGGRTGTGKVGRSIRRRLGQLEEELPTCWLRSSARAAGAAFDQGVLRLLPVVLNHGDLLPSNVLVDAHSWRLTGLVDWAEAEYLPFGMTLYGVEYLLGFVDGSGRFVYYTRAGQLRDVFWQRLRNEVPELARQDIWRAMMVARDIGILLWHGIAWDDGRLDRVVDCQRDGEEVALLETFLVGSRGSMMSRL